MDKKTIDIVAEQGVLKNLIVKDNALVVRPSLTELLCDPRIMLFEFPDQRWATSWAEDAVKALDRAYGPHRPYRFAISIVTERDKRCVEGQPPSGRYFGCIQILGDDDD